MGAVKVQSWKGSMRKYLSRTQPRADEEVYSDTSPT